MIDGDEIAEPAGQALRLDGRRLVVALGARRTIDLLMLAALFLRQQGNEGLVQRCSSALCARISCGVPCAMTLPSSIATSQSKRLASSM